MNTIFKWLLPNLLNHRSDTVQIVRMPIAMPIYYVVSWPKTNETLSFCQYKEHPRDQIDFMGLIKRNWVSSVRLGIHHV